jgi:flagellar basal-body rod modification protein FlgD
MPATEIIGAATPGGSESYAPEKAVLGKEDFLKLLVEQLKNQDPLSPMESTEFTAQLAQFSSLEQLTTMNKNLEYLQLYQSSINNAQAVNFIGKMVTTSGNSISVNDGIPNKIQFDLDRGASEVSVYVYDSEDNLVATIERGELGSGRQSIIWDGVDSDGNSVPDGTYTFEVSATDTAGEAINASPLMTAEITGVTFKEGTAYLLAGDLEIAINDILEVREREIS